MSVTNNQPTVCFGERYNCIAYSCVEHPSALPVNSSFIFQVNEKPFGNILGQYVVRPIIDTVVSVFSKIFGNNSTQDDLLNCIKDRPLDFTLANCDLQCDKKFVLSAAKANGLILEHAKRFQDDTQVVEEACKSDPKARAFASPTLSLQLSQTKKINNYLKNGQLTPVLHALSNESDLNVRLNWLRSKSPEFHSLLLYEQALAEFEVSPTAATLHTISGPLLKIAAFRTRQDQKCSLDISIAGNSPDEVGDLGAILTWSYTNRLNNLVKEHPEIQSTVIKPQKFVYLKLKEIIKQSDSQGLPNPIWVNAHGIGRYTGEKSEVHPPKKCKEIRSALAQEALVRFEEAGLQ